jgi:DNA-directed RNA polymerase specialized sigma24 family protein
MPAQMGQAAALHFVADQTPVEIAATLTLPVSDVKSLIAQAEVFVERFRRGR